VLTSGAGLVAWLLASQLRGVVFMCGAYDLTTRSRDGRAQRVGDTLLWAYSGEKHYWDDPVFARASIARHASAAVPPSVTSAGNGVQTGGRRSR
jgi:hypothetical protein